MICSDIARYGIGTAGEPTQGAGAVAMVVSENPAMLALDVGISGASSTHVHDFWRPLGHRVAEVDGHYSVQCYLDALAGAYRGWKERALEAELIRPGPVASEQLARICYHVPFCKMAKKAHVQVRRCDLDDHQAPWDAAVEEAASAASFRAQSEASLALTLASSYQFSRSLPPRSRYLPPPDLAAGLPISDLALLAPSSPPQRPIRPNPIALA